MKISDDTIGNRSRDLRVCIAVPQTLRHRVPPPTTYIHTYKHTYMHTYIHIYTQIYVYYLRFETADTAKANENDFLILTLPFSPL
jgi:hypothetical protein